MDKCCTPSYIRVKNQLTIDGNELTSTVNGVSSTVELPESGGSGAGQVNITLPEVLTLIENSQLAIGSKYRISGVYKNKNNGNYPVANQLYDDGTNSGTIVILTALNSNTLSKEGWGEFYNPIYSSLANYNNIDGTGLWGIWDGDNPTVLDRPTYIVNQVVFWGGYAWKNLSGNLGTKVDVLNLDLVNWEKLPYSNTTYYKKVVDYVEVDIEKDYITRRRNSENNIDVVFPADTGIGYVYYGSFHAISVMPWGLYSKIDEGINAIVGINSIQVNNSYCDLINFKGVYVVSLSLSNTSSINGNYFGKGSIISEHTLVNDSSIYQNIFLKNNFLYSNNFNGAGLFYTTFNDSIAIRLCNINQFINFANPITQNLEKINMLSGSIFGLNISLATIIYGSYAKEIFENSAGVVRLGYYNSSDVFTVVNVND